ncbi:MAG TPA: 3-deoxy-D-manno-octulosonic acid transferase, partial [Pyrinomonadaceae bacterium]|nr:3-deoxy-D-manno-octulosonic acid transferase [Pyrinomonadaceae bacterium]
PEFEPKGKPVVWLHCVSVGETQAARPLARAVLENFPDHTLVVSTTTRTGQRLAREIFKTDAALVFYFPLDWRFVVRSVLRKINPSVVLIMETEIWFNFLREAKNQGARVTLVNGRLSEKSFKNYRMIRGFLLSALANFDLVLMSAKTDAERIIELGCDHEKVFVTGNVKFDLVLKESDLTETFRERFAFDETRPLIIAASTHAPEERWILEAFRILRAKFTQNPPRLLIVPRHPERFAEVAALMERSGFPFSRRSNEVSVNDKFAEMILLDSIGELRAVYPLAGLVFVGGSLIPHGGQNILEPAAAQKPIVTGFYTTNFAAIVKEFVKQTAVVQLPEMEENQIPAKLAEVFRELLENKSYSQSIAGNALAVLNANRGATDSTIKKLQTIFPGTQPEIKKTEIV